MSYSQSEADLQTHLTEQLGFLKSSAAAYDAGDTTEAKRLSTALRILLHDTDKSTSLLTQLNLKKKLFYDSSNYIDYNKAPWDVIVYTGLIGQCISILSNRIEFIPILDSTGKNSPKWTDFESWWTMVVIKDEVGNTFSRKELVLNMANKDGGAHVDPVITAKYAAITRQNSLGWSGAIGNAVDQPIPYPERAAIRQITHEVMKSLIPGYTMSIELGQPYFVSYNVIVYGEPRSVDRNERCPCGSGKKYEHCHGQLQ